MEEGSITTPRGNKGAFNAEGRLFTSARYNGKGYLFYVHEIIAYVGGLDILDKQVNHIDGDKTNNRLYNLECVTKEENLEHQKNNKLYSLPDNKGSKHHNTKLQESDVLQIRKLYEEGVSQKELSKMFDIHSSGISKIVKRINWKHI